MEPGAAGSTRRSLDHRRGPGGAPRKVTVGPLAWRAGSESYWWPNLPYRAGYRAQLHDLELTAHDPAVEGRSRSDPQVRFGFRETQAGRRPLRAQRPKVNFRGDSLQGANYDNIDFHGRGDAYDTLPGFLRPSGDNGGWPKAVDNYLRLNFSGVRIHQIPATPVHARRRRRARPDDPGRAAIRGSNNRENFVTGRDNMIKHLADLVKRDRNHASVLRWSQSNEPLRAVLREPRRRGRVRRGPVPDRHGSSTRPVRSAPTPRSTATTDLPHDNYTVFCHYDGFSFGRYSESICSGPAGKPRGQGEFIWCNDTPRRAAWFATASMRMREQGASDIRPYTLLTSGRPSSPVWSGPR